MTNVLTEKLTAAFTAIRTDLTAGNGAVTVAKLTTVAHAAMEAAFHDLQLAIAAVEASSKPVEEKLAEVAALVKTFITSHLAAQPASPAAPAPAQPAAQPGSPASSEPAKTPEPGPQLTGAQAAELSSSVGAPAHASAGTVVSE